MKTRIGILGYGNLGKGVECAVKEANDMELVAVFTRRDPKNVTILTENVPVCHIDEAADWKDKIDVMILCGGSATDLPVQTPQFASMFNVIDSFDTHARIPEHFAAVDKAAKEAGKVAVISVGWDPGMFSLNRVYANAILPDGKDYTFWGKGVSQVQFVELKALSMQSSTQSLLKVLWKELDQVKILNLQQEKNMKENVLLY